MSAVSQTTKEWVVGGGQGVGHTVKLKEWLDDYVGRLIDCSSWQLFTPSLSSLDKFYFNLVTRRSRVANEFASD